jgi:hypothetical protein
VNDKKVRKSMEARKSGRAENKYFKIYIDFFCRRYYTATLEGSEN